MPIIKEINATTGEVIEREMTPEEIDPTLNFTEEQKKEFEERQIAESTKAAQKTALLEQLGITESQAKLLLG